MEYPALHGQYRLEKTLGCGGFAKVKLATHILTGEKVAIKIILKQTLLENLPRVKHEINALKSLSHTNICKLYQIIETTTHYFFIMEYCSGGELFDYIFEKEKLSESEARKFFLQIVSAVTYLHDQGFAHRDLKPENILLDKNYNLKLIDFGLSIKPENGLEACLITSCGTPHYAAPELIKGEKYLGHEIDIWSLGVLLYSLLCGCLPFEDDNIQKLYEKILNGNYEEKRWLSPESKSLLSSLLQVNARERISSKRLKSHIWFKKGMGRIETGHSVPKLLKDDEVLKVMSQYFNLLPKKLWEELQKENYDYMMATYSILMDKKKNNNTLTLNTTSSTPREEILIPLSRRSIAKINQNNEEENTTLIRTETFTLKKELHERIPLRNNENRRSLRRNCKRLRSPGLSERNAPEAKRIKESKTPITKNSSYFNEKTPRSAKKILDGLEKGLSRAKSALTPRRKNSQYAEESQPTILWGKDLCNVSSTTSKSPEEILAKLHKALKEKGIICIQKGFTLKGKLKQQSNDSKNGKNDVKLSFELEVCWIPSLSSSNMNNFTKSKGLDLLKEAVVGIRRKRLRGDAWIYKNICEEVLALAAPLKKETINLDKM